MLFEGVGNFPGVNFKSTRSFGQGVIMSVLMTGFGIGSNIERNFGGMCYIAGPGTLALSASYIQKLN